MGRSPIVALLIFLHTCFIFNYEASTFGNHSNKSCGVVPPDDTGM